MVYTGFINWGPVEAIISIYDVVKIGGHIESAKATITINGQPYELTFEWPPIN